MKIVCATGMPFVREAFETLGEPVVVEGREIGAGHVRDARLLAIRSTTKANRALLDGSAVEFVGTATIGTDHMDLAYLDARGIRWCHSPGCNANSVAEYVTSALLCLSVRHGLTLAGRTLGVVGVGNVGRLVARQAEALGLRVLRNDPPRERAEGGGEFVGLDRVLAESDILTLHVPLTREGPDATAGMAGAAFFARLKPGCLFINAARGAIVKTDALLDALRRGIVAHAVIDTWEGEPAYRRDLLERVDLGSPHIAGYSFEGRVMGTVMVYREACRFLGVAPSWSHEEHMPPSPVPRIDIAADGRREEEVLWDVVRRVYDIAADDARLREGAREGDAAHFDRLRNHYIERREFRFTTVTVEGAAPPLRRRLAAIGFRVAPAVA